MDPKRQERVEQIVSRLREQGCRITPQRMAVVRALLSGSGHATIEQVYDQLIETLPMMSRATIYKTVKVLEELGEVVEVGSGEAAHYDLVRPYPHPHITCTQCGVVQDVPLDEFTGLQTRAAEATEFCQVVGRLEFSGICPACSDNTSSGGASAE